MSMNKLYERKVKNIHKDFIQNPNISRNITTNERIVMFTYGDFDTFISNGTLYELQTEYVGGHLWKLTAEKKYSTIKNSNCNKGEDGKIRIPIELRLATDSAENERFSEDEVLKTIKRGDIELGGSMGKVLFRKSDGTVIGEFLD